MGVKRSRSNSVSSREDPGSPSVTESPIDVKIPHVDADTARSAKHTVMKCMLPPHKPLTFDSYEEYDIHYLKTHVNRCTECQKNFPDEHFLHLHIAENHDPINAAKRDRGEKTYACLIPTCDRLCSTPQKRRLHCIDKHSFPRNYDFFVVNDGIDRRSSMLRPQHRRRSSTLSSAPGNGNGPGSAAYRTRSSTMGSTASTAEGMDVVRDEDEVGEGIEEEKDEDMSGQKSPQRTPFKLLGRGGLGRARGGRGRIHYPGSSADARSGPSSKEAADPLDSLTSRMSALQFVPRSVRGARGRGRGTG